ncbi:phosphate metabolism transcription is regulated by PHO system [Scheffersomyces coipomensis]|uniref:phosphate metabolism transcription is regulated by PHO system n=1 Tax=Scheffersomyces coipomensis TaxID=1788519 RepID=UPI00315D5E37
MVANDEKHLIDLHRAPSSKSSFKRVITTTLLLTFGLFGSSYFLYSSHYLPSSSSSSNIIPWWSTIYNTYTNTSNDNANTNQILIPLNNQILSVESIDLDDIQIDGIKKLGLTPKKPIKVISTEKGEQIIHGRFLHLTDFHPDPYYKVGSKTDESCHSGKGKAGKYGDAILGCDAPMILMEDTIKWIEENLKDKIDFIVWTGDNIRHDNDREYPRTELNIFEMNEQVSDLMYKTFKHENDPNLLVDLIPSLGNNDVYPHNLFSPGPTLQTRELFKIWKNFIPQSQLHIFNRGAYFFQEVIPNQLAVLSINTLYLFQSNPLVDNCDKKKEPGYKLFEWLGYVLKEMRSRNMKVWLTGHVPPNEKNYDISCLRKYIVWSYEYRDVIIGGLYGHMNMDHFIPLDSVAAYKSIKKSLKKKKKSKSKSKDIKKKAHGKEFDLMDLNDDEDYSDYENDTDFEDHFIISDSESDSEFESDSDDEDEITHPLEESNIFKVLDKNFDEDFFRIQGGVPLKKVKYMESLREGLYAGIKGKKKSGISAERYSLAFVTASVVPTFNPGLRVWEYNITGLQESLQSKVTFAPWDEFFTGLDTMLQSFDKYDQEHENDEEDDDFNIEANDDVYTILKKKKDKTFPPEKPDSLGLGPGYVPQTFTPERYVQYFADLAAINKDKKPFGYEIEYSTDDKLIKMDTLLTEEWIKFGRTLGKPIKDEKKKEKKAGEEDDKKKKKKKKKKNSKSKPFTNQLKEEELQLIWMNYLKNTFVSSDYENRGYG